MNMPNEIPESIGGATRNLYRNASESPAVMKASPFAGWEDLKKTKLGLPGAFKGNVATAHGQKHEDTARQKFARINQLTLLGPERFINGEYAASVDDRFIADGELWILEIKSPFQGQQSKIWKSVHLYADPSYYLWQAYHQLICVPEAVGVVLFIYDTETGESCDCEIRRNDAAITELKTQWDAFYAWMNSGEPDPSDGWVERKDDSFFNAADEFKRAKKAAEEATKTLETARQALIEMCETDQVKGCGVTVQKVTKKGNVDYTKVPELKGVDLEQYRKASSEYWKVETN